MMSNIKPVEFKGVKEGIILQIDSELDFSSIVSSLRKKLKESGNFFKGAEIIGIEGRKLSFSEMRDIKRIVEKEYELEALSLTTISDIIKNKPVKKEIKAKNISDIKKISDTKFVMGTLRSGRREQYEGNITVLGDVNAGAEVVATGNIVIMGNLRGVAHAGFPKNSDAFVAAIKLNPVQLRIGEIIARPPEDNHVEYRNPEIAYVKEGMLIIHEIG
jgi:septum site-determining protein MinC